MIDRQEFDDVQLHLITYHDKHDRLPGETMWQGEIFKLSTVEDGYGIYRSESDAKNLFMVEIEHHPTFWERMDESRERREIKNRKNNALFRQKIKYLTRGRGWRRFKFASSIALLVLVGVGVIAWWLLLIFIFFAALILGLAKAA